MPVNDCAASVRATVALVPGKVIVVPSVPASVRLWLAVSVLPLAIVKVAAVAGAVIATLLTLVTVATPSVGVVSVGLVANTSAPDPVSPVTAAARLADDGVARNVATLAPRPLTPVAIGSPTQLVSVPDAGVPNVGVTNVGDVNSSALVSCLVTPPCWMGIKSVGAADTATGSMEIVTLAIKQP